VRHVPHQNPSRIKTRPASKPVPYQNPPRIKTRETRLYHYNKMRDKDAKSKAINKVVAAIKGALIKKN
jgi:hypothetical protein